MQHAALGARAEMVLALVRWQPAGSLSAHMAPLSQKHVHCFACMATRHAPPVPRHNKKLPRRGCPPQHGAALQVRRSVLCCCAVSGRPGKGAHAVARLPRAGLSPRALVAAYTEVRTQRGNAGTLAVRCLRARACDANSAADGLFQFVPCTCALERCSAVQAVEKEALWSVRRGRPRLVRAGGLQ